MNIRDLPVSGRPYEKYETFGVRSLSDAELIAVILKSGTREEGAVDVAHRLLSKDDGGLLNLYDLGISELKDFSGIGRVKAIELKCVAELSVRMSMAVRKNKLDFTRPSVVAGYYMERLRHESRENLMLCTLDGKSKLISDETVSVGTVNSAVAAPREIFLCALQKKAVYILLLHNHPSGDPSPSKEDLRVTEDIAYLGRLLDIRLLDHIIIGDGRYYSFKEQGQI